MAKTLLLSGQMSVSYYTFQQIFTKYLLLTFLHFFTTYSNSEVYPFSVNLKKTECVFCILNYEKVKKIKGCLYIQFARLWNRSNTNTVFFPIISKKGILKGQNAWYFKLAFKNRKRKKKMKKQVFHDRTFKLLVIEFE